MAEAWKVKAIREAEGLTLAEFSLITGIGLEKLVRLEMNSENNLNSDEIRKIELTPFLQKYLSFLCNH